MSLKKKLAVPIEIPEAKKKVEVSADKAKKLGEGKTFYGKGESVPSKTSYPIMGISTFTGGLEVLVHSNADNQYIGRNVEKQVIVVC